MGSLFEQFRLHIFLLRATGRHVIYPVQSATHERPCDDAPTSAVSVPVPARPPGELDDVADSGWPLVPVPRTKLPSIGSEHAVLFSFAYSAEELFVQPAQLEDLVYQVDEVLNRAYLKPLDTKNIKTGCLIAAEYEKFWYRAKVEDRGKDKVQVYFIDYGNREQVPLASVREIPNETLALRTEPLAWRCALRKPKDLQSSWLPNAHIILSEITKSRTLLAKVLDRCGECCMVDLVLPDGQLVNSVLVKSDTDPSVTSSQSASSALEPSTQQQKIPMNESMDAQTATASTQTATPACQTLKKKESGRARKLSNSSFLGSRRSCLKTSPFSESKRKFFVDDPDPLEVPEDEVFAVSVCNVLSESSLLVSAIGAEYSDKLDELEELICENFESWPVPTKIKKTNVYACVFTGEGNYVFDKAEKEEEMTKYCRARVMGDYKEKAAFVYLPDHGRQTVVHHDQLREIDPKLNSSLPYQAIPVNLLGLNDMPDGHRTAVKEVLIGLTLTEPTVFMAVRKNTKIQDLTRSPSSVDELLVTRVRKIMSCLSVVCDMEKVAAVYQDVFGEPLDNVEAIYRHMPGYGFRTEGPEIELIDISNSMEKIVNNVNQTVLDVMELLPNINMKARRRETDQVNKEMFRSNNAAQTRKLASSKQCKDMTSQAPVKEASTQWLPTCGACRHTARLLQSVSPTHSPVTPVWTSTPRDGIGKALTLLDRAKRCVRDLDGASLCSAAASASSSIPSLSSEPLVYSSLNCTSSNQLQQRCACKTENINTLSLCTAGVTNPQPRSLYTWVNPKLKHGQVQKNSSTGSFAENIDRKARYKPRILFGSPDVAQQYTPLTPSPESEALHIENLSKS
ncbi:uncharacterized protein LOC101857369 [Aplysia californica]|uniref:Uncharacterized protein LOC101857369 n=1 Tax=Aplysia californica TaxID=6500 RepID=A0ABM0K5P9_APLCA|nr:uncharacterized protein LOC101857369 [Aplysia californica]